MRRVIIGIIIFFKVQIKKIVYFNSFSRNLKNEKKFFVFCTPEHGNLGDQAIAVAEVNFLKKEFPDYQIIEIPKDDVFFKVGSVKRIINKGDVIFIHGGGNIGDLYIGEEKARRKVIKNFKDIPIIQFPQSLTVTSKKNAKKEALKSKKVYSIRKKELLLIARETKTYKKFKELFSENTIILTPDIVLTLNERKVEERESILLCLRNDVEQVITETNKVKLISKLREKYQNVIVTDTVVPYKITREQRKVELEKKYTEYRRAKVVITDRLHGMIFAVLTGTPCIVFDNYNQKVQKTYLDWLKDYKNIRFVDTLENFNEKDILTAIKEIEGGEVPVFDGDGKYKPLLDEIEKKTKNIFL